MDAVRELGDSKLSSFISKLSWKHTGSAMHIKKRSWLNQLVRKDLRPLFVLLVVNVVMSIFHYVDNICNFSDYPEPSWLDPCVVDMFWFLMTPFAVLGYWYHSQRWTTLATGSLVSYSLMSMLVLGHYLISPPWEVSFKINAFILLEATAAALLIAYSFHLHSILTGQDRRLQRF